MSRKHSLPNVDEEALAALARQFPSMTVPHGEARDEHNAAPQADGPDHARTRSHTISDHAVISDHVVRDVPRAETVKPAIEPERVRPRRGGRVLAALALLISLVALVLAVSAVAPPQLRAWLTATIGEPVVVDVLTGNRAELDARLAAVAAGLKQVQDSATLMASRLSAIEAVGGSSNAAARRVDAVEAAIKAGDARSADIEEAGKTATAQITALAQRVDLAESSLTQNAGRLAAIEEDVKRSTDAIGALAKTGNAERFFLTILHLRSATQSSGPFATELAAVRAAVPDGNPETLSALKSLSAYAQAGAPTISELRDSFSAVVAPRVVALSPAGQKGLTDRTKAWVQSIFVSRRPDDLTGGDRNTSAVALAERSLAKGQLAPALDQIVLLEDQASLVATEWLRSASARLVTDKAVAALTAQAFDRLAVVN